MPNILALWATPRSTSTAFEWMMRQRGDFVCHHEPFNELYYYGEDRQSQRDARVAAKPGFSYVNAWASIQAQAERECVFPIEEDARLMKIYEQCLPDYQAIQTHRLAIAPAAAE